MRSQNINIRKKIIVSLFYMLMGGVIFNSAYFLHTHRTACGKLIVHAHPFSKGPEKDNPLTQHQHNKIELNQFNSIDYYIFSLIDISPNLFLNNELKLFSKPFLNISSNVYFLHATRGSPATIS